MDRYRRGQEISNSSRPLRRTLGEIPKNCLDNRELVRPGRDLSQVEECGQGSWREGGAIALSIDGQLGERWKNMATRRLLWASHPPRLRGCSIYKLCHCTRALSRAGSAGQIRARYLSPPWRAQWYRRSGEYQHPCTRTNSPSETLLPRAASSSFPVLLWRITRSRR